MCQARSKPSTPSVVAKSFGATRAVDDASIAVDEGALVALLGPSGSGKTTLLRMIAGFETPDAGRIAIAGRPVSGDGAWVEPEHRRVGMVFQDGALFPHLTVQANVAFGATRAERVAECLELVGLAHRADAFPHELSGGERQRIALARALASDPDVVLLDEPFAALDAGLRDSLRQEVRRILKDAGTSALLVTHDQAEALSLADTVGGDARRARAAGRHARGDLRAPAHTLAGGVPRRDRRAARPSVRRGGGVRARPLRRAASRWRARSMSCCARSPWPSASRRRTATTREARVVGRSFFGHDQLVDLELPSGVRLRSRRLGFPAWHPGDRVRVWVDGPVNALERGAD